MMIAGLDYGTSNCAIGTWTDEKVFLTPLEGDSTLLPSTMHAPRHNLMVQARPADRSAPASWTLNPLIWPELLFGTAATDAYLADPAEGFYVKSPKSFLGARGLLPEVQDRFTAIVSAMMRYITEQASARTGDEPCSLIIGRPVNFQGAGGDADNQRALSILDTAARSCGWKNIAFLYEPMAAAMEFEARQNREMTVLVVDIGGGTTDCSFIRIGPSRRDRTDRAEDILGHCGERIGGNDYDQLLAFHGLMPELGLGGVRQDGLPVPNHLFMDAVSINDVNAQQRFYTRDTATLLARYADEMVGPRSCRRLLAVQTQRLSWRFVAASERAKVALSDVDSTAVNLDFVEPALQVMLSRQSLADAVQTLTQHLKGLLAEALTQGAVHPDAVYVTGGMARSPLAREAIRSVLPDTDLIDSDHFRSVTEGLTIWAKRTLG